jgi:hypothetical protein
MSRSGILCAHFRGGWRWWLRIHWRLIFELAHVDVFEHFVESSGNGIEITRQKIPSFLESYEWL